MVLLSLGIIIIIIEEQRQVAKQHYYNLSVIVWRVDLRSQGKYVITYSQGVLFLLITYLMKAVKAVRRQSFCRIPDLRCNSNICSCSSCSSQNLRHFHYYYKTGYQCRLYNLVFNAKSHSNKQILSFLYFLLIIIINFFDDYRKALL